MPALLKTKYENHTERSEMHIKNGSYHSKHTSNGMLCIPLYGMY